LQAAFDHLQPAYPKFYKMDRLCQFGFLASEVLIGSVKLPEATAIVLSNASSSLDTDSRFWETAKTQASPSLFVYTLPNIVIGEISIRHKLKGESAFFISPQFDPRFTVDYVDMISNQGSPFCIAGWVEVAHGEADVFLYLTGNSIDKIGAHSAEYISSLYHGIADTQP
jgi:hypothetical protein